MKRVVTHKKKPPGLPAFRQRIAKRSLGNINRLLKSRATVLCLRSGITRIFVGLYVEYLAVETATRLRSHLRAARMATSPSGIVNGPGEMADADYGYVGAARGKVSLYRRKECVEKNIPEDEAIERLLQLIESDKN